jgi:Na+/H+-dicarboxylate symporter
VGRNLARRQTAGSNNRSAFPQTRIARLSTVCEVIVAAARAGNTKHLWLTGGSLVALALGVGIGMWAHAVNATTTLAVSRALAPIGTLWINAIRMIVVPLIAAQLVASLIGARRTALAGRIGGLSILLFVTMLVVAGIATVAVTPYILSWFPFAPDALSGLSGGAPPRPSEPAPQGLSWLVGLVPANPLRAAVQDDLVGVMVFSIAFGLAVSRMGDRRSALVAELARIVADAMMTIVGWIMSVMPIAVFALAMSTAARSGLAAAQVLVVFVALNCVLMLAATLLMYPVAALAAGMSIPRFAAAILRTQIVAVSTRSSIASLPSMLETAESRLGTRREVSSLVLPVAVAVFKANRTISAPLQFLFLAHVYGIELSAGQIATYLIATFMLSFSTIGIPSGGSAMRTIPLYAAVGIPLDGYLLTEAVDAIPDIFKTLVNVTGNLTVATVVNRFTERPAAAIVALPEPTAEELPAGV